jgi:transcription initiation factor TFIIIB Brf1 subunit/transcription initiation factor TFIIB
MKCPQCKEQTLKEDYSREEGMYCPQCGFTANRDLISNIVFSQQTDLERMGIRSN